MYPPLPFSLLVDEKGGGQCTVQALSSQQLPTCDWEISPASSQATVLLRLLTGRESNISWLGSDLRQIAACSEPCSVPSKVPPLGCSSLCELLGPTSWLDSDLSPGWLQDLSHRKLSLLFRNFSQRPPPRRRLSKTTW